MRTKLRSKISLLFVVCAALLAIPAMAMALTTDTSGDTSATTSPSPTITSDKADYAPGELVTLTGSGWNDGESVNIKVNDTYGASWSHNVDVTADASGNITDSFNLPDWFVSDYDVTATGAQSGTVRTTFTDSNPNAVSVASPTSPAAVNQGSTATYGNVSVGFGGNNNPCDVTLSRAPSQPAVTTGNPANHRPADTAFPAGATANFGTSSLTGTGGQTLTSTLTVSTTNATPGGTYRFHVQATRNPADADCQGGTGVATISNQQLTLVVNDITAPSVAITSPANGSSTTSNSINVSGTASDESGIQGVKVNGNAATLGTGNSWSYNNLSLSCGDNTITAEATDNSNAHNTKSTSITVTRTCDTTPPVITPNVTGTLGDNDWYTSNVSVSWTVVDNESTITSKSAACDTTTNINSDTTGQTVSCSATSAGGTSNQSVTIKRDATAPSVTVSLARAAADHNGWYNAPVDYSVSAKSDATSGIASCQDVATYSGPDSLTASVSRECTDLAGNVGSDSESFQYDNTDPTITATRTAANANGWNNTAVTVDFTCNDNLSGVDGACGPDKTLTSEGANQSATGNVADVAGNTNSKTVSDIDIDLTDPLVSLVGGPTNGSSHYFGSVPPAPTCTASDALSGLAGPCTVSGYGTTVGSHTVKASATDNADNNATASSTYTVLGWTLLGFKSPVDMGIYNDAKGGSTVPLKFEVFAGPTELTSTSVVDYFTQKVNCASGEGDAIEQYSTGNTELRYDTTSGQFIFNWKTPKAPGSCYRVTLQTDDGSQIYADFRLK